VTINGRFEASTAGFARMTNFAVGSLNALGLGVAR
jgi:hypothetical protein